MFRSRRTRTDVYKRQNGLYVKFDKSPSGFHTSKDTALTIESLSEQYDTCLLYTS